MFCCLSSSCCDRRQGPEGGSPFWPTHTDRVCALTLAAWFHRFQRIFAAFSCSVWTQEGSDLLSMTRSPAGVIVVTDRSSRESSWQMIGPANLSCVFCRQSFWFCDSVIDAADLWFWGIQVPDAHNTHVPGGHLSVDGSGGHPEPACVWNLWHLLLRCGESDLKPR